MSTASHQDANVMLQFARWGTEMSIQEAMNWMWSDDFEADFAAFQEKYPPGSEGFLKVTKICSWYETLGTLYKHGLFDGALLFDWLLVSGPWEKVKDIALGLREQAGAPRLYENFEALAKAQTD